MAQLEIEAARSQDGGSHGSLERLRRLRRSPWLALALGGGLLALLATEVILGAVDSWWPFALWAAFGVAKLLDGVHRLGWIGEVPEEPPPSQPATLSDWLVSAGTLTVIVLVALAAGRIAGA